MNLNWLESIIYGFVSGIAKFLPISSKAHQALLLYMFGEQDADPLRDLFVHIALFLALYICSRGTLEQFKREIRFSQRNRPTPYRSGSSWDIRLIKNAAVALIIGVSVLTYIFNVPVAFPVLALLLILNGIILYVPGRMLQGNKDARSMSALDSLLIGLGGALAALPGISCIGIIYSIAIARGADRRKALNWALLLSLPAVAIFGIMEFFAVIFHAQTIAFASNILGYLLSFLTAFFGAYVAIMLVKRLMSRTGFSGFAYYSWGAALFTFILYLVII